MSIGRAFYCDGPDCEAHTDPIATPEPYIPFGFIETRQSAKVGDDERLHFCTWDCLMKYAANKPIPEVIPADGPPLGGSTE